MQGMRAGSILFFIAVSFAIRGSAQTSAFVSYGMQDPQFTQFMVSPASFNPAAAGLDDAWTTVLLARSQWVGLPGAPVSQSLASNLPIYKLNSGAGIQVTNITAGAQRNTSAALNYAFHKRFGQSSLSLGVSGGMIQQSIDGNKLITPTGTYGDIIYHNDPNLPVTNATRMMPDAGAGIYFFTGDLAVGVSANHLLLPLSAKNAPSGAEIQYNPNGYVYVAYGFELGSRFDLMPNVLYKTDLRAGVIDVNALLTYEDRFMAGVSARAGQQGNMDAVALIAGMRMADNWNISYSYDITLSALNTVSSGSHEVAIRYSLPLARPRAGKMVNNPRFLYH